MDSIISKNCKIFSCLDVTLIHKLVSITLQRGIWSNLRIKPPAAQQIIKHKFIYNDNADVHIDFISHKTSVIRFHTS